MPEVFGFALISSMEEEWERTEEDNIIAVLEESGASNYCDPHFSTDSASLYRNKNFVPEYDSKNEDIIRWIRCTEFAKDPAYFKSDMPNLLSTGRLRDQWLLGGMGAVHFHPDGLIENVFASGPTDFLDFGVYTCRLYKDGEWVDIVTDTRIPCSAAPQGSKETVIGLKTPSSLCPVYGHSLDVSEMWVPLLEKAYAKYHGSYEALNDGDVAEALVELTGGSCQQIDLQHSKVSGLITSGRLWDMLDMHLSECHLLVAVARTATSDTFESLHGILPGHAYTVTMLRQAVGFDLVRVRNVWGSSHGVWAGDWGPSSTKWDDFPEVTDSLSEDEAVGWQRGVNDGTFWMPFASFADAFDRICICRVFDDDAFQQYCIRGRWEGKSAGGMPPSHRELFKQSDAKHRDSSKGVDDSHCAYSELIMAKASHHTTVDSDPFWFNNPQYEVKVPGSSSVTAYVSLMQEDPRTSTRLKELFPIGFQVLRVKPMKEGERVWGGEDVVFDSHEATYGDGDAATREVVGHGIHLQPQYVYKVVPHTRERGVELNYTLRIFSSAELLVSELPQTHTVALEGEWVRTNEKDTAGGPLVVAAEDAHSNGSTERVDPSFRRIGPNHKWCENPQYVLTIPEPRKTARLKIVLERLDGAEVKGRRQKDSEPTIGMTICKAPAQEEAKRRRPGQLRTNALGEVMPTKESSLKHPRSRFLMESTARTEGSMDEAAQSFERKMAIDSEEWHRLSDYSSRTRACTVIDSLSESWAPFGLLIIPTLSDPGVKGSFALQVHSDEPLKLTAVSEEHSRTLHGEWAEGSSGGSHVHLTWKKNPRYHLRLLGNDRSRVKITLGRPVTQWKKQTSKDSVGSMIGFYLVQGPNPSRDVSEEIFHNGEPWGETPFVPMHEVSTPAKFELEPLEDEVYTIIPTTFEPEKHGPFFLSVTSDSPFTLQRDTGKSNHRDLRAGR